MQLLCSTGAFSRFPEFTSHRALLEYGPHLDVDGFEIMFYPAWYPNLDQIADELRQSGLNIAAIHTEKGIGSALGNPDPTRREQGVQWLEANCQLGQKVGAKVLVLHLWGLPELDKQMENNIEHLSRCLDIADQHDISLAVETIPATFADPLTNVRKAFMADPRSRIALDTEFLALHEQLGTVFETDWLWEEQRVRHIHIKDFDGVGFRPDGSRRYLHPGEGKIDFPGFFTALKSHNFNGNISLEAPSIDATGNVDLDHLNRSVALLRGYIG